MLSKKDEKVLDEIIQLEGKCMNSKRCKECPFRSSCLPEFLNPNPPTWKQRFQMALDVVAYHTLIDPDSDIKEFTENYRTNFK